MSDPSLNSKTVRPGSLGMYSYYRSARRPDHPQQPSYIAGSRRRLIPKRFVAVGLIIIALIGIPMLRTAGSDTKKPAAAKPNTHKSTPAAPVAAAAVAAPVKAADACADNTLSKLVLISISQRHMWACEQGKKVYDAPVITGITSHAATLTPPGTYHIYSKQTDTTLTGSDETGSWNDPVSYWMPFLTNEYGTYGFHDATWRSNDAFGNVSPDSDDASHGCVELPLTASAWLYGWAHIGTTVTIKQ